VVTGLLIAVMWPGVVPASTRPVLFLALAAVPVLVTAIHLNTVVLLLGRVNVVNSSVAVAALLQCGALVGWAVSGHLSTSAVVGIWVVAGAIPLLFFGPVLRPHLGGGDIGLARRMVGAGLRYHVGLVALYLLSRVDVLILHGLTPGAPVGLYTLAVSVGEITQIATTALAQAVLSDQAEASLDKATGLTSRSVRASMIMAGCATGALCLVAPWLVPALYGTDFGGSVPAIFALAPGLLALGVTRSLSPYLLRLDRPWLMSGIALLALLVNVVLNLLLIPRWGVVGCACASSAGWLVFAGCQLAWFTRTTGTPTAALLPDRSDLARLRSEVVALCPWADHRQGLVRRRPAGSDAVVRSAPSARADQRPVERGLDS
jgi:O-antigen/teichoic acid export membrane protein